jgi:predicted enzyme related to lactoylglutathione lyase
VTRERRDVSGTGDRAWIELAVKTARPQALGALLRCAQRAKIQAAEEKMVEERARSLPNGYTKTERKTSMLRTAPIRAYIPALDVSRARKFYEQTVGLTAKEEYAGGVIYECGGAEVFMYPTSNAGTSKASQAYWQVADVEAEVADLKGRGVVFEEYDMPGVTMRNSIATGGGAKTAWFKDTEGNILAISQRL